VTSSTGYDAVADVAGERLVLLPERAAYWERARTLLVADTHFGKAATFRAAGIPVPRGTTTAALARLDIALARTGASRTVFLGDFLHAREGREAETTRVVGEWRSRNAAVEMLLVRGNHDARAGDPGPEIDMACADGPVVEPPYVFTHKPTVSDAGYVLCGHIHPGARLTGPGRERAWLPCFWFRRQTAVLPAFGEFTGLGDIAVEPGDRVWLVAEGAVIGRGTENVRS
jgi:uncharacterized protein